MTTSIYAATRFAPNLLGPISVAAYSYMALVPMIQPPIIRALTTKKERQIRMDADYDAKVSKGADSIPTVATLIAGIIAPEGGFGWSPMFGI